MFEGMEQDEEQFYSALREFSDVLLKVPDCPRNFWTTLDGSDVDEILHMFSTTKELVPMVHVLLHQFHPDESDPDCPIEHDVKLFGYGYCLDHYMSRANLTKLCSILIDLIKEHENG